MQGWYWFGSQTNGQAERLESVNINSPFFILNFIFNKDILVSNAPRPSLLFINSASMYTTVSMSTQTDQ